MHLLRFICLSLALSTGASYGSPITFTENVVGSGSFSGENFQDQVVTLFGVGDTANISSNLGIFKLPVTAATVQVGTGAVAEFTDPLQVFVNQITSRAGFVDVLSFDILDTGAPTLAAYGLQSPLTVTGTALNNPFTLFNTSQGVFVLSTTSGNSTFSATTASSVTPEPSTMILVGSGLTGLIGCFRKRLLRA